MLACAGRLLTTTSTPVPSSAPSPELDRVPVGLKAHARSWVPGSQFAVLAHPEPQLVGVAPGATLKGPEFSTWLLVAKGTAAERVGGRPRHPVGVHGLRETPLPAESPVWWGTGRMVEFCGYLADLSVLYQLVASGTPGQLPLVRHRRHRRPLRLLLRRPRPGTTRRPPAPWAANARLTRAIPARPARPIPQ